MAQFRSEADQIAHFWDRAIPEPNTGCWLWSGVRDSSGYGMVMVRGKTWKVSRFAWHLTMGPIPDGKWVLHRCDTPACCNPEHLFLGTQFDNMRDMVRKGRHWTRVKPHRRATGDRHGMRLHPERRARGVDRWNALLNPDLVREIRERASRGERHTEIAASVGVKRQAVQKVVARTTWAHVA